MGPALLIALQSASVPAWFPPACQQPTQPGQALVEVRDTVREDVSPQSTLLWIEPDGSLWVREQDMKAWTAQQSLSGGRHKDDANWYSLGEAKLPYRFDSCTQTLWLSPVRESQSLSFGAGTYRSSARSMPAAPSGFANFDLFASDSPGVTTEYAGLADVGLAYGYTSFRGAFTANRQFSQRLDTAITVDRPDSLHRFRIGDGITRTDQLGTAVRYGGLRWGTEFALEPEVLRFPLPTLTGDAALPSTVELYVDGVLRGSQQVDPGPFTITNPPTYSGSGSLQVVVRDALGRETVYAQPFYIAPQALAAGVADYAVEFGRTREGFGQEDDHYEDAFGLAYYRYGISDRLTAGTRLEVQSGARTLGTSVIYAWPGVGLFSGAAASSRADSRSGQRLTLGYERAARRVSLGLQASWSDPEYVELGRTPGAVARTLRGQVGFALPGGASLSVAHSAETRRDRQDISLTAVSYSQRILADWFLSASWLHSPEVGDSSSLALIRNIGRGKTIALQFLRDANGDYSALLSWQYSPQGPLGWSALAYGETGDVSGHGAALGYTGTRGGARIAAQRRAGFESAQADLNTGIAWLGGDLYWTRPVRESFAVADAAAPGVRIYRDNQLVGTTGDNGRALVPDVLSYVPTRIGLDTEDLPLDRELTLDEQEVKIAPGGARLTLAQPARTVLQFRLRLPDGKPVSAGARLLVNGEELDLPVGHDGLVYLESAAESLSMEAVWNGSRCTTGAVIPEAEIREIVCFAKPKK